MSAFYALWPASAVISIAVVLAFVLFAALLRRQHKRDEQAPLKDE